MRGKKSVVLLLAVVTLLVFAFWYGGKAPGLHGWATTASPSTSPWVDARLGTAVKDTVALPIASEPALSSGQGKPSTPTPAPASSPFTDQIPEEPSPAEEAKAASCTVSIRCDTILDHMDDLEEEKRDLVPEGGVILAPIAVSFESGESAFDVLRRVCRDNHIHMEFTTTPIYNTAYIEGIQNLYEFDCGELSGWMYSVNGQYLSYGASAYSLQDGDVIEWQYTCQRGEDL